MRGPIFLLFALLLCAWACTSDGTAARKEEMHKWFEPNGKVKALSTVAMIGDLVKQIGGDYVDNLTLIKADLDPHSYQLVKGDDEKIAAAGLIFYNGLGLEHGPSLKQALESNPNAVAIAGGIIERNPDKLLYFRGQADPHVWMDISLWSQGIPLIVKALSEIDPDHSNEYKKNGEELSRKLEKTHNEVRKTLQAIPAEKRYLVTSHDAFNYFTRAYLAEPGELQNQSWRDRFVAPEGLAPESQLSVIDIQAIIDHLQKFHIEVLFPETTVSKNSLLKILSASREKGMTLIIAREPLYADSMGSQGSDGDTYPKMIKHNSNVIAKYLMALH